MKLTENFHLSEFESKDGSETPDHIVEKLQELADNLQKIRDFIGYPLHINSGYRSPDHNAKVGGSPNSQHMHGRAADIDCGNLPFTPNGLAIIIKGLIKLGRISEGGVGVYVDDDFVHYDIRGHKARWKG